MSQSGDAAPKTEFAKRLLFEKNGVRLVEYSDPSVVIFGEDFGRAHSKELGKSGGIGGGFNPSLKNETGEKEAGWVFPKTSMPSIKMLLKSNELITDEEWESINLTVPAENKKPYVKREAYNKAQYGKQVTPVVPVSVGSMSRGSSSSAEPLVRLAQLLNEFATLASQVQPPTRTSPPVSMIVSDNIMYTQKYYMVHQDGTLNREPHEDVLITTQVGDTVHLLTGRSKGRR
jgi:hypothetical protein